MEQTARALNTICDRWLKRRRRTRYRESDYEYTARRNNYYQMRNAAAKRSRQNRAQPPPENVLGLIF